LILQAIVETPVIAKDMSAFPFPRVYNHTVKMSFRLKLAR